MDHPREGWRSKNDDERGRQLVLIYLIKIYRLSVAESAHVNREKCPSHVYIHNHHERRGPVAPFMRVSVAPRPALRPHRRLFG